MAEQKNPMGMTGLYFVFIMVVMTILLFPSLRNALAIGVGYIFNPVFGFGGLYPIMTIVATGILLTIINTYARHYFMDWFQMARIQEKTKYLSQKMREAYRTRDMGKIGKYQKVQSKILQEQMKVSGDQMKPMIVTFIFIIAIWTWLYDFLLTASVKYYNLPWASNVDITGGISFFPYWIILYSFFTYSLGYFISYIFRLYEFKKRLEKI